METFANQPEGFSMRAFVLQLVPFIGLAGALVLGFLSWLARRMIQSKKEP
jgi:hypothetical protein